MGTFRYWQIENGEGPAATADEKRAVATVLDVPVSQVDWPDVAVERQRAS